MEEVALMMMKICALMPKTRVLAKILVDFVMKPQIKNHV